MFGTSKLLNINDATKRIGNFFKLPIQLFHGVPYPELAFEAENDKRLYTFPEEGGFFDPDAPRSPYILAQIKASIEQHPCLWELQEMWDTFSNVPINTDDEIEKPFYFWEAGTSRFEIWHWFDNLCPNGLAVDLMGETPKTK